jgi:hypothetical protein
MMLRGALSPRQQSFSTLGSSWSSLGSLETIGSDASGGVFRLDDAADDEAATLRGGSTTRAGEGSARSDEVPDVDHDESGSGEESAEADEDVNEDDEEEDKNADEDDEPAPDRAARVFRAVSAGGEGAAAAQRAGAAGAALLAVPSKGSPPPKAPAWAKGAAGLRKTGLATAAGSEQPASMVGDTGKAGSMNPPRGQGHLFQRSLGSLETMTVEQIVLSTQQEKQGPEDASGEPLASAKASTWSGSFSPSKLRSSPWSSPPPGCRLSGSSLSRTEAAAPSVLVVDVPEPVPTSPPKSPLDSPDISPTSAVSAAVAGAGAGAAAGAEAATAAATPAPTLLASPQATPKVASPFSARSGGRSPGSGRTTEVPATGSAAPATTKVPTTGSAAPARSAAAEEKNSAAATAPAGAGAVAGEGPALKPGAGCCVVM